MSISEEDIFKAEVLGYVPEEFLDSIGISLVEKVARENPRRLASTIEDLVSKHEDSPAIKWLFKHLMAHSGEKVKKALFHSAAVCRWVNNNEEMLRKEFEKQ